MKKKGHSLPEVTTKTRFLTTGTPYLVRHRLSLKYYARVKAGGKCVYRSLKTTAESIAVRMLPAVLTEERARAGALVASPEMTLAACGDIWLARKKAETKPDKQRSQDYRSECWQSVLAGIGSVSGMLANSVTLDMLKPWETAARLKFSAPRFNGQLTALRGALAVAVDAGALAKNPALQIKRQRVPVSTPKIPSPEQFNTLLTKLDAAPRSDACVLVRLLATTGLRINEARHIRRDDLDLIANTLTVRVTKNGTPRTVQLIPPARELFAKYPDAVFKAVKHHPKTALRTASKAIGMNVTPHKLRHLFATRCIERGVDVRTVAAWLGHLDGGGLLLKRYAHVLNGHAQKMAKLVKF